MKRLLVCLLLVGVVGCGEKEQVAQQPSLPQSAGGKSMARLMVLPGDRDHALQLLEELQRRAGEDDSAEDVE
jgi:hypothetical protein